MNIEPNEAILYSALQNIPAKLREKIVKFYLESKTKSLKLDNDSTGISIGKLCEAVIRLLQHEVSGTYTPFGTSIRNMAEECRKLVESPKAAAIESVRIIIPRALMHLYTMRNKRGIGHIGGDIDPNQIDISAMIAAADWIICELIRIYHKMSLEDAQSLIDGISIKKMPIVWAIGGKLRVLQTDLSIRDKTLLLLYSTNDVAILTEDLNDWVEYSNFSVYKSKTLKKLHDEKFIEYDNENELVYLSPIGARYVEEKILIERD